MKLKVKVTALALFAALNFTLVDLSGTTFVYAPQTITVIEREVAPKANPELEQDVQEDSADECDPSIDLDTLRASGALLVAIDDGCALPRHIEITYDALLDLHYHYGTSQNDFTDSFELCGVDDISISVTQAMLVNGSKTLPVSEQLSLYQISRLKQIVADTIATLSFIDGVILDDAREWYIEVEL